NIIDLQKMKQTSEKISMVTSYDYPSGKQAQEAEVDMILVGDSLGKRQIVPACFRWGLLCILYLDLFGTRHSSGRADDHGINCANLSLFDVSRLGSSSNKYLR